MFLCGVSGYEYIEMNGQKETQKLHIITLGLSHFSMKKKDAF